MSKRSRYTKNKERKYMSYRPSKDKKPLGGVFVLPPVILLFGLLGGFFIFAIPAAILTGIGCVYFGI